MCPLGSGQAAVDILPLFWKRLIFYRDQRHYQQVVAALSETMRLMDEIDAVIPAWPQPSSLCVDNVGKIDSTWNLVSLKWLLMFPLFPLFF